ncbi:MAG: hypothetical protein COB37_00095 [Kordiimonadales bacterium]|nr:MAG: hypothetical protein COB37_00095 [Kordiimonadales bacterium]
MNTAELLDTQEGADKWQRLAPAAIIHFAVQFVVVFVKQVIQGLLPIIAIVFTAGENRWLIISLIAIGSAALLLIAAVLSYLKFRFRLSGDTFLIQKGVFKRKRLSLGYNRIQNVSFAQPIYFRPFNLIVLGIESAGSSSKEVNLSGIPRALAEEIRATVFKSHAAAKSGTEAADTAMTGETALPAEEQTIISQPISELVRYGLSNSGIWVYAGLLGAAASQLQQAEIDFISFPFIENLFVELKAYSNFVAFIVTVFSAAIVIFTVVIFLSVTGSIIVNYKYHLTWGNRRFHRTRGLFERQEMSLPENKVQSLVINQGWPARLVDRFHLQLKQVGFGNIPGQPGQGNANKFLVPSVTEDFLQGFSNILYPDFQWSDLKLNPIDKSFTKKAVLWIILPISILPTIGLTIGVGFLGLLPLLAAPLSAPIIMRVRSQYGYATDGRHGVFRSGFIGHKLTVFSFYKVQTVAVMQTPGQRRRGLATLEIKMAGSTTEIPYMPLTDANRWRDSILYEIESSDKSWM